VLGGIINIDAPLSTGRWNVGQFDAETHALAGTDMEAIATAAARRLGWRDLSTIVREIANKDFRDLLTVSKENEV